MALSSSAALAQSAGKPMKITLNFLAAAPNAGFMLAKQMGLYQKAGIDLTIEEGKGSGTTAQMVATGQTDIGFADAPAAMQLRTKGAPVKIIAPVLQTSGFAIIALEDSGIASPKVWSASASRCSPARGADHLARRHPRQQPDRQEQARRHQYRPRRLCRRPAGKEGRCHSGRRRLPFRADPRARLQGARHFLSRRRRADGRPLDPLARDDKIATNAEIYKKFVEASLLGWDAARKNPDAAADAVVAQFPSVKKAQVLAQFDVVNKLLCAPSATALGKVPEANWTKSYELLTQYLGLPKDKPITDYYTTELLPASAPACP